MNDQFDELTKNLAQSVTRRAALKKLGVGLAGITFATLGLTNSAEARNVSQHACANRCRNYCLGIYGKDTPEYGWCYSTCLYTC